MELFNKAVSITKKFLTEEPLFIEMGHIVPANIFPETQAAIKKYVQEVISALNINLGIFHAELRVDKEGPVLMEIAGRLPGCRISDLIQLAKGINFYEVMLKSHLGWPIKIKESMSQFAGMRYFSLQNKNTFYHVTGIEKLRELPGFYEFKLLYRPGETVPPLTTFAGRVAMCIFTAPTYETLKLRLDEAVSMVSFG